MAAPDNDLPVGPEADKPTSRRALLGAGMGALAATIASALGRPAAVRAEGQNMVVGGEYLDAESVTLLRNQTNVQDVFQAASTSSGIAIQGYSNSNIGIRGGSTSNVGVEGASTSHIGVNGTSGSFIGVSGTSGSIGVHGASIAATGVLGTSGGGAPAAKAKTGVYGEATQDSESRGVWGRANAGQGVRGAATSGVGVQGTATTGYAFRGDGRLRFDRVSGVATIAAGATSVVVTPGVNVTNDSFVLLTPRNNIGSRALWYVPDAATDKFTIRLSSSRSSSTRVAWLLVG